MNKRYVSLKHLLLDIHVIALKWNGKTSSLGNSEKILLKSIYNTLYIEKSNLFPKNPSREAKKNQYADMNTCSACLEIIVAHVLGYWDKNKHLIGQ